MARGGTPGVVPHDEALILGEKKVSTRSSFLLANTPTCQVRYHEQIFSRILNLRYLVAMMHQTNYDA